MSEKNEQFSLEVGEDLMAAALAAVDARFAKKEPKAEEMDSFAEDLQIGDVEDEFSDEHEDFEEGEMDFAIDDEIHIDVDDDFDEPEAFQDDGVEEAAAIADSTAINALKREYTRISKQLSASEQARNDLEERVASALTKLRTQVARSERSKEKIRRLTNDAQNAREARDAAEQRTEALRQTIEKLQLDLEKSLERRRRDLAEQKEQLTAKIVTSFLPIVDHLQLALEHAEADASTLIEGVQMVMGQFLKNLDQYQIRAISSQAGAPFDPYQHEAVEMVEDADYEPNTIVRTIQTGYETNGKLIRAARVVVAKASRPDANRETSTIADDLSEPAEHERSPEQEQSEDQDSTEDIDFNQDIKTNPETDTPLDSIAEAVAEEPEG